MEGWQQTFIETHKISLVKVINPTCRFISSLGDFLSFEERRYAVNQHRSLGGRRSRFVQFVCWILFSLRKLLLRKEFDDYWGELPYADRLQLVSYFIEILKTKNGGYNGLLQALRETNQTMAVYILGYADSLNQILQQSLIQNGIEQRLQDCFPVLVDFDVKKLLEIDRYRASFYGEFKNETKPIDIFRHGLSNIRLGPSVVPRLLSNRVTVSPKLFLEDREDVFLFSGTNPDDLCRIVKGRKKIASSSEKIFRVNLPHRHILLEDSEDWEFLCDLLKVPMHWIHVENLGNSDEYVIVRSTGITPQVQVHITGKRLPNESYIPEIEFVHQLATSETTTGICICDGPGTGKSWLLASIADKLSQRTETMNACCLILLPYFMKDKECCKRIFSADSCIEALLYYSKTPIFTIQILLFLMKRSKIRLVFLFDGFDELTNAEQLECTNMLKHLNKLNGTRVLITTRPHLRSSLESTLGTIAFNILPLSSAQEEQYLFEKWKYEVALTGTIGCSDQIPRLREYAKSCVHSFRKYEYGSQDNWLGGALKSLLVAEVYKQHAVEFARGNESFCFETNVDEGQKNCIGLLSNYIDIGLKKAENLGSDGDLKKRLLAFFTSKALQIVFQKNQSINPRQIDGPQKLTDVQILAPGFLEKKFGEFRFVHRTVGEFFVGNNFTARCCEPFYAELFRCTPADPADERLLSKYRYKRYPPEKAESVVSFVFVHSQLLRICNATAKQYMTMNQTYPGVFHFQKERDICTVLQATARGNYFHLMNGFLQKIKGNASLLSKVKSAFAYSTPDDEGFLRCWHLLVTSAHYGGAQMSKITTSFLLETLNMHTVLDRMPEWICTPLHVAIKNADYDCTEYFLGLHRYAEYMRGRFWVHYLLNRSIFDEPGVITNKKKIIQLFLEKHINISDDKATDEPQRCKHEWNASCENRVHPELIKVLIDLPDHDKPCYSMNFLKNLVYYSDIIEENLADFLRYLFWRLEPQLMKRILCYNEGSKSSGSFLRMLYENGFHLPIDIIRQIVITSELNVNYRNAEGERLIHTVYDMEVTQLMIYMGADVYACTKNEGRNAAHMISLMCIDAERYYKWTLGMMNAGYEQLWKSEDFFGCKPLDLALANNMLPECLELIISKTGIDINKFYVGRSKTRSLVQIAAVISPLSTLKALTAIGADWKQLSDTGDSTLHLCVINNKPECVEYLIEQGVPVSSENALGEQAIHLLRRSRYPIKITRLLLKSGANLYARDDEGYTVCEFLWRSTPVYMKWKKFIISIGKSQLFYNDDSRNWTDNSVKFGDYISGCGWYEYPIWEFI